ncbi:hypothetical protein H1R20_g13439, partial [Candolleomyces eurysporus]
MLPGRDFINFIINSHTCLWEYAKDWVTRDIGSVADVTLPVKLTEVINKTLLTHHPARLDPASFAYFMH